MSDGLWNFKFGGQIFSLSLLNYTYRIRAIITRGFYIFYPIFHCSLYFRAVYNAERLVFHDFFHIKPLKGLHPIRNKK